MAVWYWLLRCDVRQRFNLRDDNKAAVRLATCATEARNVPTSAEESEATRDPLGSYLRSCMDERPKPKPRPIKLPRPTKPKPSEPWEPAVVPPLPEPPEPPESAE